MLVPAAAPEHLSRLPPGSAARTFGWGWQGLPAPVTQLKGFDFVTMDCRSLDVSASSFPDDDVTAVWRDGAPKYLCVPGNRTGAMCHGDLGGDYQLCLLHDWEFCVRTNTLLSYWQLL